MGFSWKIFTLFGIPIRLHWSMALLPLLTWSYFSTDSVSGLVSWAAVAVLLFGSVLLHELGHALVARRYGVRTQDIVLTPLGGMARIVNMPRTPKHEIAIAVAGPAVSLAIAALGYTSLFVVAPIAPIAAVGDGLAVLVWVNLMLGVFNMIPALPMDGGRVLRGVLALKWDYLTATRRAALVGRILAGVGFLIGVLYQSWALALISVFVFFSAGAEERMARFREQQQRAAAGTEQPGYGPRVYTWTWSNAGPRPGARQYPRAGERAEGWRPRPPNGDRDVVVIQGGKAEVISRRDREDG